MNALTMDDIYWDRPAVHTIEPEAPVTFTLCPMCDKPAPEYLLAFARGAHRSVGHQIVIELPCGHVSAGAYSHVPPDVLAALLLIAEVEHDS